MTYIAVPGPARDGAVDNRHPAEREYQARENATTFERTTDDDLHGTCGEHHLIEDEADFWKHARWASHDIPECEIVQVADE